LRSLTPEQALLKLPLAAQEYGTKHAIQEGQVHVTVADMGVKSYSPYGSWLNMYFPFGKDEALRGQFQLLNLNSLRVGRVMAVVDALCSDSCTHYLSDVPGA